jgi:hypothetical protein
LKPSGLPLLLIGVAGFVSARGAAGQPGHWVEVKPSQKITFGECAKIRFVASWSTVPIAVQPSIEMDADMWPVSMGWNIRERHNETLAGRCYLLRSSVGSAISAY